MTEKNEINPEHPRIKKRTKQQQEYRDNLAKTIKDAPRRGMGGTSKSGKLYKAKEEDLEYYTSNEGNLSEKEAKRMIENHSAQLFFENLDKFSGLNHKEFIQWIIDNHPRQIGYDLVCNIDKLQGVDHNHLVQQITKNNDFNLLLSNPDKLEGLDKNNIIQQALDKGKRYTVLKNLGKLNNLGRDKRDYLTEKHGLPDAEKNYNRFNGVTLEEAREYNENIRMNTIKHICNLDNWYSPGGCLYCACDYRKDNCNLTQDEETEYKKLKEEFYNEFDEDADRFPVWFETIAIILEKEGSGFDDTLDTLKSSINQIKNIDLIKGNDNGCGNIGEGRLNIIITSMLSTFMETYVDSIEKYHKFYGENITLINDKPLSIISSKIINLAIQENWPIEVKKLEIKKQLMNQFGDSYDEKLLDMVISDKNLKDEGVYTIYKKLKEEEKTKELIQENKISGKGIERLTVHNGRDSFWGEKQSRDWYFEGEKIADWMHPNVPYAISHYSQNKDCFSFAMTESIDRSSTRGAQERLTIVAWKKGKGWSKFYGKNRRGSNGTLMCTDLSLDENDVLNYKIREYDYNTNVKSEEQKVIEKTVQL